MASQFPPKKNTAFTLEFSLYKSDGSIIANPGTYTKKISKDGGALADITASVTEVDTTYGLLSIQLSADDMNADRIYIQIKDDTSSCVPFTLTIHTAANLMDDIKTETALIVADTNELQTDLANGGRLDLIIDDIESHVHTIDGHITADYGTTEKSAIDLLDDADGGLADIHTVINDIHGTDIPAVKTVTDKLDTVLEADGDVYRLTTNALEQAPSGSSSAPTAVEIRQEMDANSTQLAAILEDTGTTIPALINADSGAGAIAIAHTYTLTDSDDGNPIDGAEVWVTTDAAGVNVVASGTTNSLGVVTFMLDAGTYYFWRKRSGYNFTNPDTETVA